MKTIELFNSKEYPFNNSKATVILEKDSPYLDYLVNTFVVQSEGEIGEIIVSDITINGFKIEYTGSSPSATIAYNVIY